MGEIIKVDFIVGKNSKSRYKNKIKNPFYKMYVNYRVPIYIVRHPYFTTSRKGAEYQEALWNDPIYSRDKLIKAIKEHNDSSPSSTADWSECAGRLTP